MSAADTPSPAVPGGGPATAPDTVAGAAPDGGLAGDGAAPAREGEVETGRDATEIASLLTFDPVPPDATVRYGVPVPERSADRPDRAGEPAAPVAPTHPDHVIDLYGTRPGDGPPVRVVALHGGFWRAAYDRAHLSPAAAALAAAGLPVALVEYRRVGAGGGWPAGGEDVRAALDAVAALAADGAGAGTGGPDAGAPAGVADGAAAGAGVGGPDAASASSGAGAGANADDAATGTGSGVGPAAVGSADKGSGDRGFVLLGHSAGGHLALWAACRAASAGPAAGARGVVGVAPVADLADAVRTGLGGGAASALLGAGPDGAVDPALLADADPAAHPPPAVPVVLLHGTEDGQVPFDRSERWCADRPGDRLIPLPDTGHYAPITPGTPAFARLVDTIRDLLGTAPGE